MINLEKIWQNKTNREFILIFIIVALISFGVFFDLKIPDYMSEITKLVETEGTKINEVLKAGSKMVGCAFASLILAFIVGYISSFLAATFSKKTRKKLFEKVQSFSMEEIKKFRTSSIITRTTNDITNIQMFS